MEEYLDEWNGYAFTGELLPASSNGKAGFEYVIFVFTSRSYLFAQHARMTPEQLAESGSDEQSAARMLQQQAMSLAKDRIRQKQFEKYERYE